MTRRGGIALVLCVALAAVVGFSFWQDRTAPKAYTATWWDVFDTVTVVTGYASSEEEWQQQSQAIHDDLLHYHQLFDIYNTYDGLTNMATVNARAGQGPVTVDDDLFALLQFGKQAYDLTDGACNIAAGTVLTLWHDARTAAEAASPETALTADILPSETALQQAAGHMNMDDLVLDEAAQTVQFADPELQLDVGGIAKGWAVEQTAQKAEARGLTSAILNVGGNVRAIGKKPDGSRWTAGVQDPDGEDYLAQMPLEPGQSLVVSGDYQRYFTVDGVRYHHLIDLSTLQPARYCRSVAILCTDSGMGDALSTGLFCLPQDQGQAVLAKVDGASALWVLEGDVLSPSSGWPQ